VRPRAIAGSLTLHIIALAAMVMLRGGADDPQPAATVDTLEPPRLVWISGTRPVGGGGGGGNQSPLPARSAQAVGADRVTTPIKRAPVEATPAPPEPPLIAPIEIPAKPTASATDFLHGLMTVSTSSGTLGGGTEGGAGDGQGPGAGSGDGAGLGPGRDQGIGDGVYSVGGGVTPPRLVHQVRPAFTSDAMRARISGVAVLQCVVRPDGTVDDIRVVRSLDARLGLDQEAITALRQWRFTPGMLGGKAVPVLVRVELSFALR
jgi:TonB family protein